MKTQNTKHKTLIVAFCLALFSNFSYAQTQSLVATKPIVGQGYLILDKMNNPTVNNWQVAITKSSLQTDGTVGSELISTETLPNGTNYLFIPTEYRQQSFSEKYLVNVIGLSGDGSIVVEEYNIHLNDNNNNPYYEAPNVTPYALTDCRKTCLGGQYAYTIQQYLKVTSNMTALSRFQVEETYKAFDNQNITANPYYWYTNYNDGQPLHANKKVSFVVSPPPVNITVKDPAGNTLTGTVFGYAKGLGVWQGQSIIATNGQHNIGSEFCSDASWPFSQAMLLMNASADFSQPANLPNFPFLECNQPVVPVGTSGPKPGDVFKDCYDSLGLPIPCFKVIGGGFVTADVVSVILIKDLNDISANTIQINVADLYSPNGEFTGLNLSLPPSLYSFGFMFAETGFWAKIGEIRTYTNLSVNQSDMLDVNVYPNPMTGNKYTLDMKAHATLKFDYELRDFTGNLLVTKKFVLHKDHEKIQNMNEKNIPEGFLVHRFIFEDGSVKTIQAQKQ